MLSGRVVLIGFDEKEVTNILSNEKVTKLIIFDNNDESRPLYEKIYNKYKDRITLYESDDLTSAFDSYCENRFFEGIEPFNHIIGYEKFNI